MALRFLTLGMVALALASPCGAIDPLKSVRAFCRADGYGARLRPETWRTVAPFVSWQLEPAWDLVHLISGYEIHTPLLQADGLEVEVEYTVTADVRAGRVDRNTRLDRRTYHLAHDESSAMWRILGPAPVPYVFASAVDADAVAGSLDPEGGQYLSASAFVWRKLARAGWNLPYFNTTSLHRTTLLISVGTAQPGDVVLYYDGDVPYHVGLVETEDIVVSATLNAGVRRAPVTAFAGDVRYRRLVSTIQEGPTPQATSRPAAQSAADGSVRGQGAARVFRRRSQTEWTRSTATPAGAMR